jgi:hypothetical protein
MPIADEIARECDELKAMLLEKNQAYGNSALDPVRVFSKATRVEQILVRLDDKLSRLARGSAAGDSMILHGPIGIASGHYGFRVALSAVPA